MGPSRAEATCRTANGNRLARSRTVSGWVRRPSAVRNEPFRSTVHTSLTQRPRKRPGSGRAGPGRARRFCLRTLPAWRNQRANVRTEGKRTRG